MRLKAALTLAPLFLVSATSVPTPDVSVQAAPAYAPHWWNRTKIRMTNNCYAYAADDIDTREFGAMPGRRTLNYQFPQDNMSFQQVMTMLVLGAVADGMIYTGNRMATRAGFYRVALMMHPDYTHTGKTRWHWLRQDNTGTWSGKDGSGEATNLDNAGRVITDPATAMFGLDRPVAYFLVPRGGLDVGNANEPKTHPGTRPAYRITA